MRTYKQGYAWATTLTTLIDVDIISKQVAVDISELSANRKAFKQGMIDSCADWLHKIRLLDEEIAGREKEQNQCQK